MTEQEKKNECQRLAEAIWYAGTEKSPAYNAKLHQNTLYGKSCQQSHEGVFDFYKGRIDSAPNYGLKSGDEILHVILRCAFWDSFLTNEEYMTIINLCQLAHQKILENNWKESWTDVERE